MRLDAGHASTSELACASGHSVAAGMRPTSPGGSTVRSVAGYWFPSERLRVNVADALAPAVAGSDAVLCESVNGSGVAQPSELNGDSDSTLVAGAEKGTNSLTTLPAAQASGLATVACAPPLKRRTAAVNGAGGFSAKVAVSCPVPRFDSTVPLR